MKEENQPSGTPARRLAGLLDPAYVLLTVCVIAACGFLVFTTRRNTALLDQLQSAKKQLDEKSSLRQGDIVPAFTTVDAEGRQASLSFRPKQKQLLVIFSSHCSVCATQPPFWARLADEAKSGAVALRGISLDSADDTRAFVSNKPFDFPVLLSPEPGFSRAYRVERVPQLILLSEQGVVEWTHVGGLTEKKLADITALLKAGETAAVLKTSAGERN